MIPKKLVAMCGKHKIISMFTDRKSGLKWLSAGSVAACVGIGYEVTPNAVLFFLGVSEEKSDDYSIHYEEEKDMPDICSAQAAEKLKYSLNVNGDTLQPFETPQGILFVNIKSLDIFTDSGGEFEYKFTYWNETPVLLVLEYGILTGIIPPVRPNYESLLEFANVLRYNVDLAYRNDFLLKNKQIGFFDSGKPPEE